MTCIIKEADEQRNEVLDAAETFITGKGYSRTTVADILNQVGIVKSTFYYCFKPRKEVMDATTERFIEQSVQKVRLIATDKSISPIRKVCRIMAAGQSQTDGPKNRVIEEFCLPANALIHEKSIVCSILALSPILSEIVSQGVKERLFSTEHPLEAMQILLVSEQILSDFSMFTWTPCEMEQKINGFIEAMEAILGAEEGIFELMEWVLVVGSGCILQESESRRDG